MDRFLSVAISWAIAVSAGAADPGAGLVTDEDTCEVSQRGWYCIVASGAGHSIQAERPLWTAAMIEGFLAGWRDPGDHARGIPDAR